MAITASPYGLKPVNLIGGQVFAGQFREYKLVSNNTAAIFNGDLISLTSAGVPVAATATPTAGTTAGIVGVCVGVRYVSAATKQPLYSQFLPANAVTGGYTDVYVRVSDDPDALYTVQGSAALGTFNSGTSGSGWPGAIGKNAALGNFSAGSTVMGNSAVNLVVGTNGASLATTATLALRIVDIIEGTEGDAFPEFVVKLNQGVHSYYFSTGV
jgi:hypothetical protein